MQLAVRNSSPSFDIRTPSELLSAPFPFWMKFVWIAIRSFQGSGKSCRASYSTIGERCVNQDGTPMDKSQVARAVHELMETGWLYRKNGRELVCTVGENVDQDATPNMKIVDQESTLHPDQRCMVVNEALHGSQRSVDQDATPSENQQENQKENKRGRGDAASPFPSTSWQYQFSIRFRNRLKELECLHAEIDRASKKRMEDHMQSWADVIDKLNRLDGHSQDTIAEVFRWLLDDQNWWISTKNIRSATKLREKSSDGEKYFDVLKMQMQAKEPVKKKGRSIFDIPELGSR